MWPQTFCLVCEHLLELGELALLEESSHSSALDGLDHDLRAVLGGDGNNAVGVFAEHLCRFLGEREPSRALDAAFLHAPRLRLVAPHFCREGRAVQVKSGLKKPSRRSRRAADPMRAAPRSIPRRVSRFSTGGG